MRFESGSELRRAAEERAGRELTADEWSDIDPEGWSAGPGAYDERDLQELVALARSHLRATRKTRSQRVRESAMDRTRRTAAAVSDIVEEQRHGLFGSTVPPFETAADAALWIESNQEKTGLMLLTLTVELPARESMLAVARELHNWLGARLAEIGPQATDAGFMRLAEGLRSFGTPVSLLPYLPGDAGERQEIGMARVHAPPGSLLERVLSAAEHIQAVTGWALVACVHHLLTGGLMSTVVETSHEIRVARGGHRRESMQIHVEEPSEVDVDTVAGSFVEARGQPPSGNRRIRRSRRSRALVEFVGRHQGLTWRRRTELWNRENPAALFPTLEAMRAAYRRAGLGGRSRGA